MTSGRSQVVAALVLGAVLLASACTGPSSRPAQSDDPIRIAVGADLSASGIYQRLVDAWNARHPEGPARLIEVSPRADLTRSQLVAVAQSNRTAYDIYLLDVVWTAQFAAEGYIEEVPELSQADQADFLPPVLDSARYDGKLYGLPFATDAGLLYYRADVLADYEGPPPERWDEWGDLWAAAEDVVPANDQVSAGFVGQFAEYEGLVVNVLEHVFGRCGADVPVADDLTVTVNDCVLDTLRGLKGRFGRVGAGGDAVLPNAALGYAETESLQRFTRGEALFMRNWPYAYGALEANPDAPPFEVAPLPGPSVLGGQNLALAADAPHREAALELMMFLTSTHCQRRLMREGNLAPTRNSAYNHPWGDDTKCRPKGVEAKPSRRPDDRKALPVPQRCYETNPNAPECHRWISYLRTIRAAVTEAKDRPKTPYYPRFSEVFQQQVHDYLQQGGDLNREAFADALRRALDGK